MKSVLRFPASFQSISASEAAYIIGGAEVDGVTAFLDNVSKLSKLFNYMACVFSATSAMLNNFLSVYNTIKSMNEYIEKNF